MSNEIYVPTSVTADSISVAGTCYRKLGDSPKSPTVTTIDEEFGDCDDCSATCDPCECCGVLDSVVTWQISGAAYTGGPWEACYADCETSNGSWDCEWSGSLKTCQFFRLDDGINKGCNWKIGSDINLFYVSQGQLTLGSDLPGCGTTVVSAGEYFIMIHWDNIPDYEEISTGFSCDPLTGKITGSHHFAGPCETDDTCDCGDITFSILP